MKHTYLLFFIFTLSQLTGCLLARPKPIVNQFLTELRNGDLEKAQSYCHDEIKIPLREEHSSQQVLRLLLMKMDFETTKVQTMKNDAIVTTNIKNPNLVRLLAASTTSSIGDSFGALLTGQSVDLKKTFIESIQSYMNQPNLVRESRDINVGLIKEKGGWKIKDGNFLIHTILLNTPYGTSESISPSQE